MNQAELDRLLSDVAIRRYYEETYDALLKQFEEMEKKMKESNEVTSAVKNKIDPSKKYRKVSTHEPVRIICTDRKIDDDYTPCVGLWLTKPHIEAMVYFNHEGVDPSGTKIIEEIPQTDWSKVQGDSPIWVCGWPVHFARFDTEKQVIQYYHEGKTSHSNELKILGWNLPENCSLEKPNA